LSAHAQLYKAAIFEKNPSNQGSSRSRGDDFGLQALKLLKNIEKGSKNGPSTPHFERKRLLYFYKICL